MAVCKACGADLSNRPHYPWCPNAGWVPFDAWAAAYEHLDYVRVDNGAGAELRYSPLPGPAEILDRDTLARATDGPRAVQRW